jgi:hypothetical protein
MSPTIRPATPDDAEQVLEQHLARDVADRQEMNRLGRIPGRTRRGSSGGDSRGRQRVLGRGFGQEARNLAKPPFGQMPSGVGRVARWPILVVGGRNGSVHDTSLTHRRRTTILRRRVRLVGRRREAPAFLIIPIIRINHLTGG